MKARKGREGDQRLLLRESVCVCVWLGRACVVTLEGQQAGAVVVQHRSDGAAVGQILDSVNQRKGGRELGLDFVLPVANLWTKDRRGDEGEQFDQNQATNPAVILVRRPTVMPAKFYKN